MKLILQKIRDWWREPMFQFLGLWNEIEMRWCARKLRKMMQKDLKKFIGHKLNDDTVNKVQETISNRLKLNGKHLEKPIQKIMIEGVVKL